MAHSPLAARRAGGDMTSTSPLGDAVFRRLFDRLDLPLAVLDGRGRFVAQNHAHRELLDYPDDELLGAAPDLLVDPGTCREILDGLIGSGAFQGPVAAEHRRDETLPMHLHAFAVPADDHGVCYVWTLQDAASSSSELLDAERSVSLLKAALDATADGLLMVDRNGRIVSYNRRFTRIWGLPADALASRDDEVALALAVQKVKDPDAFLDRVHELYASPDEKSFDVLELLDGRVIERYSRPQRLGGEVVGRVWSFRDVTTRHRAEAALRESEESYRRLFTDAKQPIYLTTPGGRILDVNPAFLELFGYRREEIDGLSAEDFYEEPAARRVFRAAIERDG
ncbi:MAG: PAS domain S-box protein, partial [Rhodothermales bacterium]|nr:PAS domain S-box protein [Rhodothermales bacterium]